MSTEHNTAMQNRSRQDIASLQACKQNMMAKKKNTAKIEYSIRWGTVKFKGSAPRVYEEIYDIGETATPQQIVDFARNNPESELHKCFDWDDEIAAEKWRKQQARIIVCNLVIEKREDDVPTGNVYRVIQENREAKAYQPAVFILNKPEEYEMLLTQAKKELESFKNRYQKIVELETIIRDIEDLLTA